MTPKERVRTAMARRKPDRLPAHVSFNTDTQSGPIHTGGPSAQEKIMRHLGTERFEDVLCRLGIDIRSHAPRSPAPDPAREQQWKAFTDGMAHARTAEDLRRLRLPDFRLHYDLSHLREDLEDLLNLKVQYAIQIGGPSLWEWVRIFLGFERSLVEWLMNPEFMVTLLEILYQLHMPVYEAYATQLNGLTDQIDCVYAGSDFAMQDRPMIDPQLFERDYVPFVAREVREFKTLFPNAFFMFHCCGAATPFLPALVRAGVQVLHPVQPGPTGMSFETLKGQWGSQLAFAGGVDAQRIMARGTTNEVRQWVRYSFETLGRDGGFMIAPHGIMPEVPVENVLTLFDTVQHECVY